jgi:hypothetical protein
LYDWQLFFGYTFSDACQNNASTKINLVNNNNKNSSTIIDYCFVTKKKEKSQQVNIWEQIKKEKEK